MFLTAASLLIITSAPSAVAARAPRLIVRLGVCPRRPLSVAGRDLARARGLALTYAKLKPIRSTLRVRGARVTSVTVASRSARWSFVRKMCGTLTSTDTVVVRVLYPAMHGLEASFFLAKTKRGWTLWYRL